MPNGVTLKELIGEQLSNLEVDTAEMSEAGYSCG